MHRPADISVVIHGPRGCGKTFNAEKIAAYFALPPAIDVDDTAEVKAVLRGMAAQPMLVLTSDWSIARKFYKRHDLCVVSSFHAVTQMMARHAAAQANDAVSEMLRREGITS